MLDRRFHSIRLVLALSTLSLVTGAGCKKPVDEALVTFAVMVDAQVPTLTTLAFSVTTPAGVPPHSVTGDAGHRSFRYGYYMPGVNGTATIQGSALDKDGCTIGRGMLVVAGIVAGKTTDGGTMMITKVPMDCTTASHDASADQVDGSRDALPDALSEKVPDASGDSNPGVDGGDGGPICMAGTIGCACATGGVCNGGLACANNLCRSITCGDGVVDQGERCDDGNTSNTDGCLNTCVPASCGDGFTEAGVEACDDGNQSNTDSCTNTCKVARCGDGFVQGTEACDDGATDNGGSCLMNCMLATCGDGFIQRGVETCDDGNRIDTDACSNTCKSATCGDGVMQTGEPCDDANTSNTDTCLNDCTRARCGDGFVQAGVEACDDGNTTNTDSCTNACALPKCGDGFVQGTEACDDGNTVNTDGCTNGCKLPICGDGILQTGEQCDDGNTANADGCLNTCKTARCGDGFVQQGVEACDDGNTSNTDTCTNTCVAARCGDGFVQGTEQCDDANAVNTDTCTNACTTARCGDGFVQGTEACDDGNAVNTDTCTNACAIARCGDGFVQGTEACDDGNAVNTDTCTNACAIARCGDGFVQGTEACDDGNAVNTDTCTNACTIARCGDGFVQATEQCDDGNTVNTDACTNACKTAVCGDGIAQTGVEECDDGDGVDTNSCTNACLKRYNIAFISSATYPPLAMGGVAGADTKCQTLATAGGLTGQFVAWISDSTSAVKTRLGTARGWLRPDGKPFLDDLSNLYKVYYPPEVSELNTHITSEFNTLGGTGMATGLECTDWTSNAAGLSFTGGNPTGAFWSSYSTSACANLTPTSAYHLYCFQRDFSNVLTFPKAPGRLAFLTPTTWSPQGGLAGADTFCQTAATAASLPGRIGRCSGAARSAWCPDSTPPACPGFAPTALPWSPRRPICSSKAASGSPP
jgi:cysteine-rich repeat protein